MRLDLTAEAAREPLVLAAAARLDARERAFAIDDWRGRMVSEHVSARVFAALVDQMMRAGIDAELQAEAATMIGEELRHARQCARVVAALGGEAVAELPELDEVPTHDDVDAIEGLLRNLVSVSIHETIAVAIIEASRHAIEDPALIEIVTAILGDEVGHARLGWRVLEREGARLDARARARLSDYLEEVFRQLRERNHLDVTHRVSDEATRLGVCDGRDATALFVHAVEAAVVPLLETHGLAAGDAWRRSARPRFGFATGPAPGTSPSAP